MTKPTITDMMMAYGEDAVDYARSQFQINLDYSEASLAQVEHIMTALYNAVPRGFVSKLIKRGPSPETMTQMAKMFGGYIGEVIRRHLGGNWTFETQSSSEPAITLRFANASEIYPPSKVHKRLTSGSEDNVEFYYQVIKAKLQEEEDRLV